MIRLKWKTGFSVESCSSTHVEFQAPKQLKTVYGPKLCIGPTMYWPNYGPKLCIGPPARNEPAHCDAGVTVLTTKVRR